MFAFIESTRFKMRVARVIYFMVRLLRLQPKRTVFRHGVRWEIDLAEGIDMSLFLLGEFQPHVTNERLFRIPQNAVIFDVGANVGSIALPLASKNPGSTVYAFEPTHFAFKKLLRNLQLNEALQSRIVPIQTFVSSSNSDSSELTAYSSWTVDDLGGARHPVHLGLQKDAITQQITLDSFVTEHNIDRLDLLKIDTDGHELDVLKGGLVSLQKHKPVIVFEMTKYLLAEKGEEYEDYERLLAPLGYCLWEAQSGKRVDASNVGQLIPEGGGVDIVAIPGADEGRTIPV